VWVGVGFRLVEDVERRGWLSAGAGQLGLTPEGERQAIEVIRAHRLWERYLADEARMPLTAVHAEAERREHARPPGAVQALDAATGYPATDPHGDPIPAAASHVARTRGRALAEWPLHTPARIVHLEDEPAEFYRQMVALGLRPGLTVEVIDSGPGRLVVSDGEKAMTLAPLVAANILVAPAAAADRPAPARTLAGLKRGRSARVRRLDDSLQGFTRRRLLDLGLTPGAAVTAELNSLLGDPVAYRVRGALIALRREQAAQVFIDDIEGTPT
jgi:DtxR family Mn-dependent transcriptional regulator